MDIFTLKFAALVGLRRSNLFLVKVTTSSGRLAMGKKQPLPVTPSPDRKMTQLLTFDNLIVLATSTLSLKLVVE